MKKNIEHPDLEALSACLDNRPDEATTARIREHCASCASCGRRLREMEAVTTTLHEMKDSVPAPAGLEASLLEQARKVRQPAPPILRLRPAFGLAALFIVAAMSFVFYRNIGHRQLPQLAKAPQEEPSPSLRGAPEATKQSKMDSRLPSAGMTEGLFRQTTPRNDREAPKAETPANAERDEDLRSDPVSPPSPSRGAGLVPRGTEGVGGGEKEMRGREVKDAYKTAAAKETPAPVNEPAPAGKSLGFEYAACDAVKTREKAAPATRTAGAVMKQNIAPTSLVIREKSAWETIWQCQNAAQNIVQPLPPVDFKKQMAIAVSSRNDGIEYQVVKTEEKPDKIVVLYREMPAQKRPEPLPPYQINVVNNKPSVEFQRIPD